MATINAYTGRKEIASLSLGWTISKFKEKMDTAKPGEYVQLSNVEVGETSWKFLLYANGYTEMNKGNISMFCKSLNENAMLADVSIAPKEGNLPVYHSFTHNYTELEKNRGYGKLIPHNYIKDHEEKFLKNGDLELVIKMTVYGEEKTTIKNKQNIDSLKIFEKSKVAEDFKECWMDDSFSDVKINCGGMIFNCHRIILARRSNYFSAMLKGSFREGLSGVIEMENMDPETFKAILKYIFEGELDNLETKAMELLEAAERFELASLKTICEDFLIDNYMKLENVIDTLLMAILYKGQKLKQ